MDLTSRRLTAAAGWTCAAFGAAHTVIAPLDTPVRWSRVLSEGWWHSFTLSRSETLADFQRAETFWITLGSFGAPMLVLGSLTVWAARHEVRVPGWIGWMLVAWGAALTTALPASPAWVVPVVGGLLIAADRRRRAVPSPVVPA